MPPQTIVPRLIELLPVEGLPKAADPDRFKEFVQAVVPQARGPYLARRSNQELMEQLVETFAVLHERPGTEPKVWGAPTESGIMVLTNMPDQSFIVDTVRLLLLTHGANHIDGFNAVVSVGRNKKGFVERIDHPDDGAESIVLAEAQGIKADQIDGILKALSKNLHFAQLMVRDFAAVTKLVEDAAYRFSRKADRLPDRADTLRETAAFLRWLLADNFVFMSGFFGDQRLGIATTDAPRALGALENWGEAASEVQVRKGKSESPVHRSGRLDEIRVSVPTNGGEVETLVLQGLFTYRAVTQPSRHVPLLRRNLAKILREQGHRPRSFRYKGVANVFDSLPTEFLFTTPQDEVARMIDLVLDAEHEQRPVVHITQSQPGDLTFVLAAMPKGSWSDRLRQEIEETLVEATGASYCDHGVFVGRYDMMLLHYYLTGSSHIEAEAQQTLVDEVKEMAATWQDRLLRELVESVGQKKADGLMDSYGHAFLEPYIHGTAVQQTVVDIAQLDHLDEARPLGVDMFVDAKGRVNLRLYHLHNILLSDVLPVLDNFGLIIIDQFSDSVKHAGGESTIDTFRIKGVWGMENVDLMHYRPILVDALEAVFSKKVGDDPLNRILLRADIPWNAVDMVRAYVGYARQLGLRYTVARTQELLLAQPQLVKMLWATFQIRFDPNQDEKSRDRGIQKAKEACEDALRALPTHDQDLTFRTLFNLVESTVRTNFYRTDRDSHYISFKFDCSKVQSMPLPKLMFEVYVHHRDMEGVHLRGGKVARGGIRWSDREDFRREVLDLATTQMVKNVLIVPEGAKGGFFIKHALSAQKDRRRQADLLYQTFMRGLLDLTDNWVNNEIVHPPNTVRHDDDDWYMVVAADKGTAHLSDTANQVSRGYDFWLDDACASGGSNGYDHKKVGITARGAWTCVRRHFKEMGINPLEDIFTCVGIGDPSGDVFGNGVVETPKMKLLAAFNHLHVFIDPNPDPDKSYEERLRLFKEAKGWDHYNTNLISSGGGIFDRKAKSIPLSPEIKEMLGILKDELPVDTVIRLLLRLNCHLLWNGGIGTYVKASHESNRDAGDPANDILRVNANELRCHIIGEGGNLGLTQAARLEFALNNGRINTDAIDNSGGVDMSDHEVNLKILLRGIVGRGEITDDERNALLEKWTDEVAHMVLANNDTHARQISLDQIRAGRDPMAFAPIINYVTRISGRTRQDLGLPTDDVLGRRRGNRQGITRPELAVISGHIKMRVFKEMMAETTREVDRFDEWVTNYFPKEVQDRWADDINGHMLHREIGMTVLLQHVMADAGIQLFPLLADLTGATPLAVCNAWTRLSGLINLEQLRRQLNATEATLENRYRAWTDVTQAMVTLIAVWLSPGSSEPTAKDHEDLKTVLSKMPRIWGSIAEESYRSRVDKYVRRNIPTHIAHRVASLGNLPMAWDITRIPIGEEGRLSHSVIRYIAIGEASRILAAMRSVVTRTSQGPWDPVAMGILRQSYATLLLDLVNTVDCGQQVRLGVDRLAIRLGRESLHDLQQQMDRVLGRTPDLATLLVAQERVRAVVATAQVAPLPTAKPKAKRSRKKAPSKPRPSAK